MDNQEVDYYALLGIAADANAKQIRTAYRQKSLKVHPDRNPDNPEAAHLFHELSIANEILSDPAKREGYDKIHRARQARAERFKHLDSKRKNLASDLNAREEAYKRAKTDEHEKEKSERLELERLRNEGEKMRRTREKQQEQQRKAELDKQKAAAVAQSHQNSEELGALDTTVRLRWPRKQFPLLELEQDAIAALLPIKKDAIDSIVISSKMASNPKLKNGTAVVALKSLTSAVKVVEAGGKDKLAAIEVSWASGQEPETVRRARERNQANGASQPASEETNKPDRTATLPQQSVPKLDEDNVLELMRARERERERLEEEIRRQDAEDEAAAI